jgi:hypothetical protein
MQPQTEWIVDLATDVIKSDEMVNWIIGCGWNCGQGIIVIGIIGLMRLGFGGFFGIRGDRR